MNIGFYLTDIDGNNPQHQTILNNINSLCANRPYDNIVLFNNKINIPLIHNKFYILHLNKAKYFKGILFLFNVQDMVLTQTFPCPTKQIVFINEPTWNKNTKTPYMFWHNLYYNDNFEFIVDNQDMYDLFSTCWKNPIAKFLNFDYNGMNDVIQKL